MHELSVEMKDAVYPIGAGEGLVQLFLGSKSPLTRAAYSRDLESFRQFTGLATLGNALRTTLLAGAGPANAAALAYRGWLVESGLAPATVNRRLAAIRSVLHLARLLGLADHSIDVPGARTQPYRDTRGPGLSGVQAMAHVLAGRKDARGARDTAILRLMFDLGLRRGEVCALNLEDLDLDQLTMHVVGKGRRESGPLSLPLPTAEAIQKWLECRGRYPGPLFTNFDRARKGRRLTGQSVYRVIQGLGRAAGLGQVVRPHGLRHSAITVALDLTAGDVRAVQRFSRHAKLETVTIYDDNRLDLGGQVAGLVAAGLDTGEGAPGR